MISLLRRMRGASLLVLLAAGMGLAAPDPLDETIRILEQWTASHWGRDCFVWVLHYPDELIGPWIEAEAARAGMTDAERRAYRESFVSELRLDRSEAFLVSVYSFGPRPLSLAPVKDNVALVTSSGARLRPDRYDSSLDSPTAGVVQGLVFFPKQSDKNFALAVKGMGPQGERLFSFSAPQFSPEAVGEGGGSEEVVVVDLPRRSVRKANVPQPEAPKVVVSPPPPPPVVPRPVPPLMAEDSSDMAEFVSSLRDRPSPDVRADKEAVGEGGAKPQKKPGESGRSGGNSDNRYMSREQALRNFLALWADNRAEEMYTMLSDSSRRIISRENFAREVTKAADFRAGLKDGYRIDWVGEERAKVITDRRLLMFRSLVTRTLGVVREDSSWRVVW